MNFVLMRRMLRDPELSATDKLVGVVLFDRSGIGGACWLDRKTIAFEAGTTPRTVTRSTGRLKRRDYITIEKVNPGELLPSHRPAREPHTVYRVGQKWSYPPDEKAPPCHDPKVSILQGNESKSMNDKTSKSSRYNALWQLFHTIEFCTKSGNMSTVIDNVAVPEPVCAVLSGPLYAKVDIDRAMNEGAAWTCEHKKNRRDRLGAFLRNWFTKAAERKPATQQPRYYEVL